MKSGRFWLAVLAAGVVVNILDFVVWGWLLEPTFSAMECARQGVNQAWYVIGDFVAIFVLAWVFDKVYASFAQGPKGGATFGLYVGVLMNFPMWIFAHLMFKDLTYSLAWILTVYGVIWAVIAGAILGALYKKGSAA